MTSLLMCLESWPVLAQNWPSETTGQLGTISLTMVHTTVKVSEPWLPVTSGQLTYRLEAVSNLRTSPSDADHERLSHSTPSLFPLVPS